MIPQELIDQLTSLPAHSFIPELLGSKICVEMEKAAVAVPNRLTAAAGTWLPHRVGVYFLFDGESLVYIGKSTNILTRLNIHRKCSTKVFDRVAVIPLPVGTLFQHEAKLIRFFKPRANVLGKADQVSLQKSALRAIFRLQISELDALIEKYGITPMPTKRAPARYSPVSYNYFDVEAAVIAETGVRPPWRENFFSPVIAT